MLAIGIFPMDDDLKESIVRLLKPFLIAAVCFAIAGTLFKMGPETTPESTQEENMKALGFAFGGFVFVAAGAGVLLIPVGRLLGNAFESIFWPSGKYTPPALFKLAEWYTKEGRYGDALVEYEKITKNHPRSREAYEGMLYVQYACMGNTALATTTYQKAFKKVPNEQKDTLSAYYQSLESGTAQAPNLSSDPPWAKHT